MGSSKSKEQVELEEGMNTLQEKQNCLGKFCVDLQKQIDEIDIKRCIMQIDDLSKRINDQNSSLAVFDEKWNDFENKIKIEISEIDKQISNVKKLGSSVLNWNKIENAYEEHSDSWSEKVIVSKSKSNKNRNDKIYKTSWFLAFFHSLFGLLSINRLMNAQQSLKALNGILYNESTDGIDAILIKHWNSAINELNTLRKPSEMLEYLFELLENSDKELADMFKVSAEDDELCHVCSEIIIWEQYYLDSSRNINVERADLTLNLNLPCKCSFAQKIVKLKFPQILIIINNRKQMRFPALMSNEHYSYNLVSIISFINDSKYFVQKCDEGFNEEKLECIAIYEKN